MTVFHPSHCGLLIDSQRRRFGPEVQLFTHYTKIKQQQKNLCLFLTPHCFCQKNSVLFVVRRCFLVFQYAEHFKVRGSGRGGCVNTTVISSGHGFFCGCQDLAENEKQQQQKSDQEVRLSTLAYLFSLKHGCYGNTATKKNIISSLVFTHQFRVYSSSDTGFYSRKLIIQYKRIK